MPGFITLAFTSRGLGFEVVFRGWRWFHDWPLDPTLGAGFPAAAADFGVAAIMQLSLAVGANSSMPIFHDGQIAKTTVEFMLHRLPFQSGLVFFRRDPPP